MIFTTDSADTASIPSSWTKLPSYLGRSDLSQIISADIACFVGFSNGNSEKELTILSSLSPHCHKETSKTFYSPDGPILVPSSTAIRGQTLERAVGYIQGQEYNHTAKAVSLERLAGGERPEDPLIIIACTGPTSPPAKGHQIEYQTAFQGPQDLLVVWSVWCSGYLAMRLDDRSRR